jgi:hypothetical protein
MKLLEIESCYQCHHVDYHNLTCKHNWKRPDIQQHYFDNTVHPDCKLKDAEGKNE